MASVGPWHRWTHGHAVERGTAFCSSLNIRAARPWCFTQYFVAIFVLDGKGFAIYHQHIHQSAVICIDVVGLPVDADVWSTHDGAELQLDKNTYGGVSVNLPNMVGLLMRRERDTVSSPDK